MPFGQGDINREFPELNAVAVSIPGNTVELKAPTKMRNSAAKPLVRGRPRLAAGSMWELWSMSANGGCQCH